MGNRVENAKQLDAIILEILTAAEGPLTSGQIFQRDARLNDKKAVTNALTRLKDTKEVVHDGGGYTIGKSVGTDQVKPANPTDRALALLGRQFFGASQVEYFEAKVQCLQRMEQLMEPHIGRLLRLIREDLERYNALYEES